jgi:hypothetical protein
VNPTIILGDRHYTTARGVDLAQVDSSVRDTYIHVLINGSPPMIITNECKHCHRFDVSERVAYSWDQAIEYGWLIEVDEQASDSGGMVAPTKEHR